MSNKFLYHNNTISGLSLAHAALIEKVRKSNEPPKSIFVSTKTLEKIAKDSEAISNEAFRGLIAMLTSDGKVTVAVKVDDALLDDDIVCDE